MAAARADREYFTHEHIKTFRSFRRPLSAAELRQSAARGADPRSVSRERETAHATTLPAVRRHLRAGPLAVAGAHAARDYAAGMPRLSPCERPLSGRRGHRE